MFLESSLLCCLESGRVNLGLSAPSNTFLGVHLAGTLFVFMHVMSSLVAFAWPFSTVCTTSLSPSEFASGWFGVASCALP